MHWVKGYAKKRTRVMTHSIKLAKRFVKAQCANDRRHVQPTDFRAKPCQDYLIAFCDAMCMAAKQDMIDMHGGEECIIAADIFNASNDAMGLRIAPT